MDKWNVNENYYIIYDTISWALFKAYTNIHVHDSVVQVTKPENVMELVSDVKSALLAKVESFQNVMVVLISPAVRKKDA